MAAAMPRRPRSHLLAPLLVTMLPFLACAGFTGSVLPQPPIAPSMPVKGIAAHRGANTTHPENTLAAFREAIRLGVQQIEFDVRVTADDQLVVIHDDTVNRTTNGRGQVDRLTLDQIRTLDAGSWKDPKFKGEKVPTLLETLRIMPRNVWLNVHVKGDPWVAGEVATLVVEEDPDRAGGAGGGR